MPKTIKNDRATTWEINDDDATWTLEPQATITVDGEAAVDVLADSSGNLVRLFGDIVATSEGGSGVLVAGDDTKVVVGQNAVITAQQGIVGQGADMRIVNKGEIAGVDDGISSINAPDIKNFGEITADNGIAVLGSSRILNGQDGVIQGDVFGVVTGFGHDVVLVNHGEITGGVLGVRMLNGGENRLVNTGSITGGIEFGKGDDLLDSSKGLLDGAVSGGEGDDTYKIGANDVSIIEANDEGYDVVYARVYHTLGQNVETLKLVGKHGSGGFGNYQDNTIYGSRGNDTLGGGGGDDVIKSGRGDDFIQGNEGEDVFIFYPGFGKDRVLDFTDGEDLIAFNDFDEVMNYEALAPRMSQHGNHTWISMGNGDRLIVTNTDVDQLTQADFT